jgi:membrane protein YqaA with SNARE-associated domain
LKTLFKYITALQALGPWGIFLLAGMDGAGVPLPGALDLVFATYVYQAPARSWMYVAAAAIGSSIGSVVLYWIGYAGGEVLIERRMSPAKFQKIQNDFERHPFVTVALPAMLPPPFPLKVVVLSAGAFEMRWTHFLFAMIIGRLVRFAALAVLTIEFGLGIVTLFRTVVRRHPLITILLVLVIAGVFVLVQRLRRKKQVEVVSAK